jgi:hypothetical protein
MAFTPMESSTSLSRLLDRLEAAKRAFGTPAQAGLARLLGAIGRRRFTDAASLIRFHEALLFFRAYPPGAQILRLADELLASTPERIDRLRRASADQTPLEEPDVSGIAGTAFSAIFTYDMTRWLAAHHPATMEIDWDGYEAQLLGPLLRRLLPFYAEDALVEANIPYLDWFRAAKKGRGSDLRWLISEIERLPLTPEDRAELWAGARLPVRWELGDLRTSRTHLRFPGGRKIFYHHGALLRRSDVSVAAELQSPALSLKRLSGAQGERILDLARETSAMRYRELHGFTYGDPKHVFKTDFGRGVEIFVWGVPARHRLPLRAYHAGIFFKNSVPLGYVECLTLFEHMEVGFNLYYTFREGETAWLYARLLRLFHQLLNVTCFAVDPYQIGLHNEEAIESGAFWFYRKLGFRPADRQVVKLLAAEEAKLQANPAYRTPARTLERLAAGWMIYEMPGSRHGDWNRFEVRRVAMALDRSPFPPPIGRAKNAAQESRYVRALENDPGLRRTILKLGSRRSGPPALG